MDKVIHRTYIHLVGDYQKIQVAKLNPTCLNILENADANVMVVKDLNDPEHYLLRYEEGSKIDDTKPIGIGTGPTDLKIIQYAARTE